MNDLEKYLKEIKERCKALTDGPTGTTLGRAYRQDVPRLLEIIKQLSTELQDELPDDWVKDRIYPDIYYKVFGGES